MFLNIFSVLIFIKLCNSQEYPVVSIGTVNYVGSVLKTWKGNSVYAFRGIRYAEPPIGDLRFKDPQPLQNQFSMMYNATQDGNDCPSLTAENPSEDCLFLNVYTNHIPNDKSPANLRPVIVFIHFGGFYVLSSRSSLVGPDYLLEKDVILVTFNYRLGTLGFLNLNTKNIPGNAGFKDQVLALRWIQENISSFGGNPHAVTLMGYSAGGLSVSLHLVSPMSQGLFHKAIIMSGTIPPQTKIPNNQMDLAQKQAQILGCEMHESENDILECLNKFDGNKIASTLREMFYFGKDNPMFLWLPIIENNHGQDRFLIKDPYELFQTGKFSKVPILTGFTRNEFCTSAVEIIENDELFNQLSTNFNNLAPKCFMYPETTAIEKTEKIYQHYFPNGNITKSHIQNLCDLFSDSIIKFGTQKIAEIASKFVDVYTYEFSYSGRYSNLYYPAPETVMGAEHMDDLMYIFRSGPATFTPSDPESSLIEDMTSIISDFALFGKPLRYASEDRDFWNEHYIQINKNVSIEKGRIFRDYDFWRMLF